MLVENTVTHTLSILIGLTLNFSRMLGDLISGSPGEVNYIEVL